MDASMKVIVGADVTQANTALKSLDTTVTGLGKDIQQMGGKFAFTNAEVNKSSVQMAKLTSTTGAADKIVSILNKDIGELQSSLAASNSGLGTTAAKFEETGKAAKSFGEQAKDAYSVIRQAAFILPGIGVSGLISLGLEGIAAAIDAIGKAASDNDGYLKAYNTSLGEAGKTIGTTNEEVHRMAALFKDAKEGVADKTTVLNEYNEKFGASLGIAKDYNEAEAFFNSNSTAFVTAMRQRAIATAAYGLAAKEIADNIKKTVEGETTGFEKFKIGLDAIFGGIDKIGGAAGKIIQENDKASAKLVDNYNKIGDAAERTAQSIAKASGIILDGGQSRPVKIAKVKIPKAEIEDRLQEEPIRLGLLLDTDNFKPQDSLRGLQKKLDKTPPIQIPVDFLTAFNTAEYEKKLDHLKNTISQSVVGIGEGLAEDIGKAFSGSKNPFGNIMELIGDGLEEVGKQLIIVGGLAELIRDALGTLFVSPTTAIIVGGLAIAIGAGLKSLGSKKGVALAEGGIVTGPTNALIGEAGQPEVVFPLDKLNQFIKGTRGSQNINVGGQLVVKGTDLVTAIARTNKNQGYAS